MFTKCVHETKSIPSSYFLSISLEFATAVQSVNALQASPLLHFRLPSAPPPLHSFPSTIRMIGIPRGRRRPGFETVRLSALRNVPVDELWRTAPSRDTSTLKDQPSPSSLSSRLDAERRRERGRETRSFVSFGWVTAPSLAWSSSKHNVLFALALNLSLKSHETKGMERWRPWN